jgi:hypothetical protein
MSVFDASSIVKIMQYWMIMNYKQKLRQKEAIVSY